MALPIHYRAKGDNQQMATTKTRTDGRTVYVPVESFAAQVDGIDVTFREDHTRVSQEWLDDHKDLEHLFRPMRVHYDVEAATAAPGELR